MTTTIKMKRTLTAGNVPTLEAGEFGIDLVHGRLYYGDDSATTQMLVHKLYVATTANPPTHIVDGLFWFRTDTQSLWLRDAATWKLLGISEKGGTFKGHIIVRNSGDTVNVLQTTDGGIVTTGVTATGQIALTAGQIVRTPASVAGTGDATVAAFTVPVTTLTTNLLIIYTPPSNNTVTNPTFTADATAAKTIVKASGPLVANDLVAGKPAFLVFDGTDYELLNPAQTAATPRQTVFSGHVIGTDPAEWEGTAPNSGGDDWEVERFGSTISRTIRYVVTHNLGSTDYRVVPTAIGNSEMASVSDLSLNSFEVRIAQNGVAGTEASDFTFILHRT